MKDVVINTSKLNSLKFRVLTSGIDISQYLRNPVLLWMHRRPTKEDGSILPIGRIENLRVEGDSLIGIPVFDESDEFAQKIKAKWDAGFLRMVSAGLDPVELSADPALMVEGQKKATVTRSKLVEVSIVDIGANDDAIALYRDGEMVNLSAGGECSIIPEIEFNQHLNNKQKAEMKTIALKLGLPETATEAEILAKIGSLQLSAQSAETLQAELEQERERVIDSEVESAIRLKRITADKKAHFIALGKTAGLDSLKATLELIPSGVKPTDVIRPGGGSAAGATDYKKLSDVPESQRIELRRDDPETYKALYKAEYGVSLENYEL
jgi:hypothetical protein